MPDSNAAAAPALRRASSLLLAGVLLALLYAVAIHALHRPVSFDGAMNLQVAKALAEGKGYVREYEGTRPFPIEVQTNVPFVLPAAGVFAVFGVGLWQSQVTNLAYLVGLLALVIAVTARYHGYRAAMLTALAVMLVPGFFWIGMNGWGELTCLFWWLAGTFLLLKDTARWRPLLHATGACCLGLALATKTVMLIGIGATTCVYGLSLVTARRGWRQVIGECLLAAGFLVLPLLVIELWRAHAMGLPEYRDWWAAQFHAVTFQTGVVDKRHAASGGSKLARHFAALSQQVGLPGALLATWLALPLLGSLVALLRGGLASERNRVVCATALVVFVYLGWWLMLTPDTHVRLRRIEIGLVLLQWLWALHLAYSIAMSRSSKAWTTVAAASLLVLLATSALFARAAIADAGKRWRAGTDEFDRAIAQVQALPPAGALFGKGFLSAPTLALYADRRVEDIDGYTAGQLSALGSGYILVDPPAAQARRFEPELKRYPHALVVDAAGFKVYRLDFATLANPFSPVEMQSTRAQPQVDFSKDKRYALVYGLQGATAAPWRWARTDAEVLLRYNGARTLVIDATRPRFAYLLDKPLQLAVSLDGCDLGSRELPTGRHALEFPIDPRCAPVPGRNARVRIEADNMLVPNRLDLRQHSYVLAAVGFR